MSDHDELIAQFIEISGGEDENIAKFYLSTNDWNLEEAIANFLGSQRDSEDEVGTNNKRETSSKKTSNEKFERGASGAKPKIATLSDMTVRHNNEEEGQAFYAGGSERSGQQVLGPPKRKDFKEQLTDMFRLAQDQHDPDVNPLPSTSSGINWGQGMRLGMTDNDHTAVLSQRDTTGEKKPVVLRLWSQGFAIDDGELRPYDDPANKEFLTTVLRGEIPKEFLELGWRVNVDVEDHRNEDYKKNTTVKTFKGSGHTLGSPTPMVEVNAPVVEPSVTDSSKTSSNASTDDIARASLNLDTSAPTTTLQIRLADGTRLAAQFNMSHTVNDIHQYIQNARPQYANTNFLLVSSFPTRELKDLTATIKDSNLKNAALMQRLV